MEYIIGILLLISFVGLAVYAVRGGNLMMGMLIMAIIWTVLSTYWKYICDKSEFIGSYPGITDISVVDAITKSFPVRSGRGKCTCKYCIWCMVWTCSSSDRYCRCTDP